MMSLTERWANFLRDTLAQNPITQELLAKAAGVGVMTIYNWLYAKSKAPNAAAMDATCRALGISFMLGTADQPSRDILAAADLQSLAQAMRDKCRKRDSCDRCKLYYKGTCQAGQPLEWLLDAKEG